MCCHLEGAQHVKAIAQSRMPINNEQIWVGDCASSSACSLQSSNVFDHDGHVLCNTRPEVVQVDLEFT